MKTPFTLLIIMSCALLLCSIPLRAQDTLGYQKMDDSLQMRPQLLTDFYEKEHKRFPNNKIVLQKLGRSYLMMESFPKAEKVLKELLLLDTDCGFCYLGFSHIEMYRKNLSEALENINKAIAINAKNKTYYLHRADVFQAQGKITAAEDDLKKAIEIDPTYYGSYYQRSLFYKENNSLLSAISDLEKALELQPLFPVGINDILYLYQETGQLAKALPIINNAIKGTTDASEYYYMRAQVYFNLNEWQLALDDLKTVQSKQPNDFRVYQYEGFAKYQMEDMDGACAAYNQSIALLENRPDVDPALKSNIIATMNDFCDETKASYYYQRGIAAFNHGKYQDALDQYHIGLQKFPDNSMMLSFKANALLRSRQYEAAITNYQLSNLHFNNQRIEINSNSKFSNATEQEKKNYLAAAHAMNYYNISECYFLLSANDQALLNIDSAIHLYPKYASNDEQIYSMDFLLLHKGKVLVNEEQYDAAITLFSQIIQNKAAEKLEAMLYKAIAMISKELNKPTKVQAYSFSLQHQQTSLLHWQSQTKGSKNINTTKVNVAIDLCDEVIKNEPDYAFAYLIRGQIKWLTEQSDHCYDLIKAKQLEPGFDIGFAPNCK